MHEPVTEAEQPVSFAHEGLRVGKNMSAMLVSRIATMALGFVQTGVILRALDVEGAGRYGYALGFTSLFTVFATFGIHRLVMRDVARDRASAWQVVWSAEAAVVALNIALYAIIAVFAFAIEKDPLTRSAVLSSALWVVTLYALQRPLEGLLMALERMELAALLAVVGGALRLACVYLVLRSTQTAAVAHLGVAGANALALVFCLGLCLWAARWKQVRPDLRRGLTQLRECLPFLASALASLIYFKADISVLKFLAGVEAAGIYMPGARVIEPLAMLAALWGTTVFPSLCRLSHQSPEHYERLKKTSLRFALIAAFPMATGLAVFARPAIALLAGDNAEAYEGSIVVMQALAAIVPFFYFNGVVQEFLYSVNRNWLVSQCYWLAAAVSVPLNLLLVPVWGVMALPVAAIAANLAISVLFALAMRGDLAQARLAGLIVKSALSCGGMALAAWVVAPYTLAGALAASGLAYVVLQAALGAVDREERRLLGQIARRSWERLTG